MKSTTGNFFEDFSVGMMIRHATPRTITTGEVSFYAALYGPRFALQSSNAFARAVGYPGAPVDDLLVFHMVFGKSVPDISLNAVANLGYAECRFVRPVFCGDTVSATSVVIGLRQGSAGDAGIVYLRTSGFNQHSELVLEYTRWVLVRKRDLGSPAPVPVVPRLADRVDPVRLGDGVPPLALAGWDTSASGSSWSWKDYEPGEEINHSDGFTIEEAEHQLATRLYQNTARVHVDAHAQAASRLGRRLVYGGVVMSVARALSFNGLANGFHIAAINAGRHAAPCTAGDTIYAESQVLERAEIPDRSDIGALRTRLTAKAFAAPGTAAGQEPRTVLELDLWLVLPRL
jgi:2-methylfumaryl-CoA hydratase